MSLRLLPAIIMDDEDDDGNFTKWMSSYWGHGAERCEASKTHATHHLHGVVFNQYLTMTKQTKQTSSPP
uniref:Uncharacterized protein n=1 Tax=Hippocampus comes TaxID=109280 RepID=A0A3Q2XYC2_HIPCM